MKVQTPNRPDSEDLAGNNTVRIREPETATAATEATLPLSVVIVNWNTGELLRKCLRSVRSALLQSPGEVIVADNSSTDGSERVVEDEFPEFRLLRSGANIGFGPANDRAAGETHGKHLLFLNPDTVVQSDTFRILLEQAGSLADPAIVGCRIRLTDGQVQPDSGGNFFTPGRWWLMRLHAERLLPDRSVDQSARLAATTFVDWVSGVCLLVDRRVFLSLGGFDERMFAYLEDMDLCRRARNRGIRSLFTTATEISHFRGASFTGRSARQTMCFLESQILYVGKHWPLPARAAFRTDRFLRYSLFWLWSRLFGNRDQRTAANQLVRIAVSGRLPKADENLARESASRSSRLHE
jgi:GT2 family glycosyltransferase